MLRPVEPRRPTPAREPAAALDEAVYVLALESDRVAERRETAKEVAERGKGKGVLGAHD